MFDPRTTKDELVYYATKDSKFPRGRVSLAECTIGGFAIFSWKLQM